MTTADKNGLVGGRVSRPLSRFVATLGIISCFIFSPIAYSASVDADDAALAAKGWTVGGSALGGAPAGDVAETKKYDGWFVVTFEGGGYVVLSSDTDLKPVISWSKDGEWIDDEARNPMFAMMGGDFNATQSSGEDAEKNNEKWAKFIAAGRAPARLRKGALLKAQASDAAISESDPRVPELLKSRWAQGNVGGSPCYNYCTPLHRASGCVATMAAQIMHYHKWPRGAVTLGKKNRLGADRWSYGYGANSGLAQVEVESGTFGYYEVWCNELLDANGERWLNGYQINGYQGTVEQTAETRYTWNLTKWEPAFGGTYDWDNMLDDPQTAAANGTLTDANRLAIGHLVRDIGITVPIRYEMGGGEGSARASLALSLVDTFQYADAVYRHGEMSADEVRNIILANLDARLPVGVTVPGHAIVADGYGYVDGELYIHFNMGWGGGGAWHNPPIIYEDGTVGSAKYNTITSLIYNIRPQGEEGASIVSGRVLDGNGSPVEGVMVRAVATSTNLSSVEAATDSRGIYALFLQPGEHAITAATGTTVARTNLAVVATTSPYIFKDSTVNEGHEGHRTSVGNIWGVELTLAEASETELGWVNETADTTGRTGTWSVPITYDATTKTAEVDETDMFTATTPSGGAAVTVEVTAKLCGENGETPPNAAQAAIRLGANGCFQVWTKTGNGEHGMGNGWVDVEAEGMMPSEDVEYTFRFSFDYAAGTYSVKVKDGAAWQSLNSTIPQSGNLSFPIAVSVNSASAVGFRGSGTLKSIIGTYFESFGFMPGDMTGNDAAFILNETKAAWLNGLGDYASVSGKVATLTAESLEKAYLLNLDVTSEEYDGTYTFKVTSIEVADGKAMIDIFLERPGKKAQATNGVLKFYGSGGLEDWGVISDVELSSNDEKFSDGDTATAEIELGENTPNFFRAKIEEK